MTRSSSRRRASWCTWSARARTRSSSSRCSCPPTRATSAASCRSSPRASWTRSSERFPDLEPVEEGKARINKAAGYSLVVPRQPQARALYGRLVLLPQPVPGARDGVKLLLLATPAGGAGKATRRRHPRRCSRRPTAASASGRRARDTIDFDQFLAVDMRVGRIVAGRGLPGGAQARLEADDRLRRGARRPSAPRRRSPTTPARSSRAAWSSRS